jgi:hypothetical protein
MRRRWPGQRGRGRRMSFGRDIAGPLIDGEKYIVHCSEEPRTGAIRLELIGRERQECGRIACAAAGFRTRHMHRLGAYGAAQIGEVLRRETCLASRRMALRVGRGADPTHRGYRSSGRASRPQPQRRAAGAWRHAGCRALPHVIRVGRWHRADDGNGEHVV